MKSLVVVLLLLATPALAAPPRPSLTDKQQEALTAGKVLVLSAGDESASMATGIAEIAAPPEAIWAILTSVEHIRKSSKAVKELTAYEDTTVGADHRILKLDYMLKVGFTEIRYAVQRDIHATAGWMEWKLDRSRPTDLKDTTGSYVTFPGNTPGTTLFVYRARIVTGMRIPAWLEEDLTEGQLKKYIGYVKKTAEGS